jgi:hypothetical protein
VTSAVQIEHVAKDLVGSVAACHNLLILLCFMLAPANLREVS